MGYTILGEIILLLSLVILGIALYYLIEIATQELLPQEGSCEVEHAAKKNGRRKDPGLHFVFSKQSKSHTKRGKVCTGKQSFTHSFVR